MKYSRTQFFSVLTVPKGTNTNQQGFIGLLTDHINNAEHYQHLSIVVIRPDFLTADVHGEEKRVRAAKVNSLLRSEI